MRVELIHYILRFKSIIITEIDIIDIFINHIFWIIDRCMLKTYIYIYVTVVSLAINFMSIMIWYIQNELC